MTRGVQAFDYSVDLLQSLLWQMGDAVRLRSLIEQKNAWYAVENQQFWSDWYRDVFDLQTANDFGLAVWALILGIPLVVGTPGSGARVVFGFEDFGDNFDQAGFGSNSSGTYGLTTDQKRLALRLRYYQLTTRATVPEINRIMSEMFSDSGNVYVLDGGDMTVTYVFDFEPGSAVRSVLQTFDLLPRPAGVMLEVFVNPSNRFGFEPYYLNFDQSNFGGGS